MEDIPPTAEWRTLALDPANDTPIYRSPRNGPGENGLFSFTLRT
jgi:hypothetical protein